MKREMNKRLHTIGNKIKQEYRAERVILFGSHARGMQPKTATWTCSSLRPPRSGFSKEWPASGVSFGTCGMALPYLQ